MRSFPLEVLPEGLQIPLNSLRSSQPLRLPKPKGRSLPVLRQVRVIWRGRCSTVRQRLCQAFSQNHSQKGNPGQRQPLMIW
tara:strand:- start:125 stop:367 length:243 start_codon:yes stop_codon:yes gene_type:complete